MEKRNKRNNLVTNQRRPHDAEDAQTELKSRELAEKCVAMPHQELELNTVLHDNDEKTRERHYGLLDREDVDIQSVHMLLQ